MKASAGYPCALVSRSIDATERASGRHGPTPAAAGRTATMVDDPTAFVLGGSGGLPPPSAVPAERGLGIAVDPGARRDPFRGLYRFTGGTMEEGFMLYFPELMRRGQVPNVDFLHLYGPGSLHVLLGWYELFGYTLVAERTFGLLQHLAIIFGLFALARRGDGSPRRPSARWPSSTC